MRFNRFGGPDFPTHEKSDGHDDEDRGPDFEMSRVEESGELDANPEEGDDAGEVKNLENQNPDHHAHEFGSDGSGKRKNGRAEQPGGLDRIAPAADGDGKLRRVDGDIRDLRVSAEKTQDGVGQPRIGLQVAVESAVEKRQGDERVEDKEQQPKFHRKKEDGAFAFVPIAPPGGEREGGLGRFLVFFWSGS